MIFYFNFNVINCYNTVYSINRTEQEIERQLENLESEDIKIFKKINNINNEKIKIIRNLVRKSTMVRDYVLSRF